MIEMRLLRAVIGLNSDLVQLASEGGHDAITEDHLRGLEEQEVPVKLDAVFAGRNPIPSGYEHSLPANMVMFIMINLLVFGGASVSQERNSGVIRRMAAYPITRFQLIMGKVYGRFLLGAFQIVLFLIAGRFIFGVRFGSEPEVIFLGLRLFAWVAASLGVLIGSLISGEEKTVGLCVATSMVMGALGGCWWPMEIVSDTMKTVGHLTPTAWAMDLMHQLISFGGGAGDVITEVGVLIGFGFVTNALAAKFFKYD
jgi:ABC-2 type transport system permease protein